MSGIYRKVGYQKGKQHISICLVTFSILGLNALYFMKPNFLVYGIFVFLWVFWWLFFFFFVFYYMTQRSKDLDHLNFITICISTYNSIHVMSCGFFQAQYLISTIKNILPHFASTYTHHNPACTLPVDHEYIK